MILPVLLVSCVTPMVDSVAVSKTSSEDVAIAAHPEHTILVRKDVKLAIATPLDLWTTSVTSPQGNVNVGLIPMAGNAISAA